MIYDLGANKNFPNCYFNMTKCKVYYSNISIINWLIGGDLNIGQRYKWVGKYNLIGDSHRFTDFFCIMQIRRFC